MSRPAPEVVTAHLLRDWPLPDLQDDKDSRGQLLVVGGSRSNPGGVMLAAEAALRVGAGTVRVVTVDPVAVPLAVALPEVWVRGVAARDDGQLGVEAAGTVLELAEDSSAVLLGPGMGSLDPARQLAARVLGELHTPVLVDALALAAVTADNEVLSQVAARSVLTPNLVELSRTLGWDEDKVGDDPREASLRLAARTGCCVSSGGAVTWTASPDGRSWEGSTGGPGLGTSGSGDVKAGIVAGLLARGAEPAQAAVWGSHVHGSTGDRLAASVGPAGFVARELLTQVPRVLAELQG